MKIRRLNETRWGASRLALLMVATLAGQAAAEQAVVTDDTTVVVVTAQKRQQRLIDVPLGVDVLSAEALEKRSIDTVADLAFAVPGLTLRYDGPGSSQIFMRGAANIRGSDALVASYMDEVPVTLTGGFRQIDLRALDVERVEVLKGPQGTLYGQGAMAGTVRFVTASPRLNTFEGNVKADLSTIEDGDLNTRLSGAVTLPLITDKLALRVAAAVEDGGGWIDQPALGIRDGNNQDVYNVRAKLYYKPNEAFDLMATVGAYSMKSRFTLAYENGDRTRPVPVEPTYDLVPPRHDRSWIYNLTMGYETGIGRLTSSTSHVRLNRDYSTTYIAGPGTPYAGIQNEGFDSNRDRASQFTQELRLSSTGRGAWQYTAGIFYRDAEGNLDDNGMSYFAGGVYPFVYIKHDTSESWSLFADVSYRFTDRLTVGVGLRTFRDEATAWYGNYQNGAKVIHEATFDSTDPRLYATWALTPTWNLYGNVAKGFRSGGFNGAGLPPYDPEKLINYEIGTKGIVAEGRVSFDLAVYFSQYDDALRTGQFFNYEAGGGFISLTRNIGEMEIKGVEGSLNWWATPQLQLSASGAYTDSKVTRLDIDAGSGEDVGVQVGDPGDYAPKWSYSLAADYRFDWSEEAEGFFHVAYSWRDKVYAADGSVLVPRVQSSQSAGLLDARLGASWAQVSLELYVNNLTNENRRLDPYHAWGQSTYTKPRTVGIALSRSF